MGKKKFIEKKKSATFQLISRDSSDPNYTTDPSGDRVFVRVDNNRYNPESFFSGDGSQASQFVNDPDSIFADAPDEYVTSAPNSIPDDVREEILALGFPDDGYNYLMHMREIKNSGGGSAYYQNPKAEFQPLPNDIKAYDASRVKVSVTEDDANVSSVYNVASRTVGVRIQKVIDPEVAALLDDNAISVFDSDSEDLDEDFVVKANLPEDGEEVEEDENLSLIEKLESHNKRSNLESSEHFVESGSGDEPISNVESGMDQNPRVRRLLDEQFDLLQLQEYGTDGEYEYDDDFENHDESLVEKLNYSLKEHVKEDFNLVEVYRVPADLLHEKDQTLEETETAADVIRKCMEYGKKYENEDEVVVFVEEESSDESEKWDCETIVTTFSNLDNHPGIISAPEGKRKKKKLVSEVFNNGSSGHIITLGGKEKLPLEFLPHRIRKQDVEMGVEKEKSVSGLGLLRKKHGQETKEEKKERKAAVKAEKSEARKMKKEMRCLYKSEGHQAQKVAASSGPSSIHLM
ncbi:protein LTV1 homolog [Impatiens glandulifera]|uniref:protein LTV1 homolog n=1 Tax=Impatiens glandulifera TaxID=253017 RepID=UPI001FB0A836|nr:protein LTV1 homolog [Impatiens glandulifera]